VICVDTNLLVYAHRSAVAEHRAARRALERAASSEFGWGVTLVSVAEFWSVVTHPAAERPSTPAEAEAFITALARDGGARIWLPSVGFETRLLRAVRSADARGPRIFDVEIALIALENGARELWSHDRSFLSLPGLRVVDPLDEHRA
jgi:toxin-antitoxin system PIN domain toxin